MVKLRWRSSKNRTNEPFMSIAGYFEDNDSDELTNDPVFKAVLNKDTLSTTNHFKIS